MHHAIVQCTISLLRIAYIGVTGSPVEKDYVYRRLIDDPPRAIAGVTGVTSKSAKRLDVGPTRLGPTRA